MAWDLSYGGPAVEDRPWTARDRLGQRVAEGRRRGRRGGCRRRWSRLGAARGRSPSLAETERTRGLPGGYRVELVSRRGCWLQAVTRAQLNVDQGPGGQAHGSGRSRATHPATALGVLGAEQRAREPLESANWIGPRELGRKSLFHLIPERGGQPVSDAPSIAVERPGGWRCWSPRVTLGTPARRLLPVRRGPASVSR